MKGAAVIELRDDIVRLDLTADSDEVTVTALREGGGQGAVATFPLKDIVAPQEEIKITIEIKKGQVARIHILDKGIIVVVGRGSYTLEKRPGGLDKYRKAVMAEVAAAAGG